MTIAVLIGNKVGMTQMYKGECLIPVTIIKAKPCPVTWVRSVEIEGYSAIQIGSVRQKQQRLSKGELGHLRKRSVEPLSQLKEFRLDDVSSYKIGQLLTTNQFLENDLVDITSRTKGHGFQGVVKRWNFSGGPASHGSMFHRRGGSYGMCQWPGKVYKGRKMPGHMGDNKCTVRKLKVVSIINEDNLIIVKGSLPGPNGINVFIKKSISAK